MNQKVHSICHNYLIFSDFSEILEMEQMHLVSTLILIILPMYHDFFGPRRLQGTHMGTLKPKNLKSITFTLRGSFFTFLAILAHSASVDGDTKFGNFI